MWPWQLPCQYAAFLIFPAPPLCVCAAVDALFVSTGLGLFFSFIYSPHAAFNTSSVTFITMRVKSQSGCRALCCRNHGAKWRAGSSLNVWGPCVNLQIQAVVQVISWSQGICIIADTICLRLIGSTTLSWRFWILVWFATTVLSHSISERGGFRQWRK